jgi:two-component system phosphate regulon sensor histidine kinase PhoR
MSVVFWMLLGLVGLIAVWLAWRHIRLLRAIRAYARDILADPRIDASSVPELAALGRSIRTFEAARVRELSALQFERDRLAAVLDQMTDGVLIADAHGVIQYSNPAAQQLFRVTDPLGRSVTEVLRDHRLVDAWQDSRASGSLQSASAELPLKQQFLHLVVLPDAHAGGSLLLAQDLTRIRRLETVRQDFISNFSHELRTPLASLKALAETLANGALGDAEAGPRFLQRIVTEVDALTQMSQELLELSAIESGKADLEPRAFFPQELLDSAAERMKLQADRAGLDLRVECPPGLPVLQADFTRLEQVLVNLIHNAIKFTQPGGEVVLSAGAAPLVEVAQVTPGDESSGTVRFSVRDTGRGISAEDLPRIFERFYRADKARTKGGTGLGLSIARHIVEAHGGQIRAESQEGRGSTFFFSIPASS